MKEFVYNNKPMTLCYGCRACIQACPYQAITMHTNHEGFWYPRIDQHRCTECQLCTRVCPTQDENRTAILHKQPQEVFAAWSKNFYCRLSSTSGGIFYVIAEKFIREGGIVYGCRMNDSFEAEHIRVTDIATLMQLRGSKYLQSNVKNTFTEARNDLRNGEKVLYSGTPCQIAGLKLFLRKEYIQLFTIDVVCHGTPSPEFFQANIKYIEETENRKLTEYRFRDKKRSGWRPYVSYRFSNYKKKYLTVPGNFYGYAFYNNLLSRMSCYKCRYSCMQRAGDITLSDFWGAEKHHKELKKQRKHGFNMVLCNSEKGKAIFHSVSPIIDFIQSTTDVARQSDVRLNHPVAPLPFRHKIYKIWKKEGYNYLAENYSYKSPSGRALIPLWIKNIIKEITKHL